MGAFAVEVAAGDRPEDAATERNGYPKTQAPTTGAWGTRAPKMEEGRRRGGRRSPKKREEGISISPLVIRRIDGSKTQPRTRNGSIAVESKQLGRQNDASDGDH